jgi:hypothetical protein
VGKRVEVPARCPPEHRDERGLRQPGHVRDGREPARAELAGGDRADPPEPLDGERMQEVELALGRHDEQAVGLGDAARHLGEELRPGHADRDGQTDPLAHLAAQARGDLRRGAREALHAPHVEERFVDRQPFDERRRVLEHPVHRLARLGVCRHARLDDDRLRAQAPRLRSAHRRSDAVGLRLVARREHDAGAHDHGPAAQARVVALLDRRVERVEVGVEDRRLARHEHMFVQ